jgi:hypothetical protein
VPEPEQSSAAFVLMPFEDDFDVVHRELIAPALSEVGYDVKRADSVIDQRSVLSDIVLGIDHADLVVADLTGLNPNVFYELGIAHGLGIPTVLITQVLDELPFDLRTYRVSEYSTRFDEATKLKDFLREVGREAQGGGVIFSSPVSDFIPNGPASDRLAQAMKGEVLGGVVAEESDPPDPFENAENAEVVSEMGSLDLLHGFISSQERSTEIMGEISEGIERLGSRMGVHSDAMQAAVASEKPGKVARIHRQAAAVARDFTEYGDELSSQLPALEEASKEMIDCGVGWITKTGPDQDPAEVRGMRLQQAGLYVSITEALASTEQYRDSFGATKGLTGQLDKASDRVVSLIGRVLAVMKDTQSFAVRLADIAQELIDGEAIHFVEAADLTLFSDAAGSAPRSFKGMLLATFDRGVAERFYPYESNDPPLRVAVSVQFDSGSVAEESWVIHPFTEELTHAWTKAPIASDWSKVVLDEAS